jgi:hypothetical protein
VGVEMGDELLQRHILGSWVAQKLIDIDGDAPGADAEPGQERIEPQRAPARFLETALGREDMNVRLPEEIVDRPVRRAVVDDEEPVHPEVTVVREKPGKAKSLVPALREKSNLSRLVLRDRG